MSVRVAVDAMGGDHAPSVVVEGAVEAARAGEVAVVLVGPEEAIRAHLDGLDHEGLPIQVVNAPEVIGMDESPTVALKTKRQSSIHIGLGLHKRGDADAFISAGNTGAVMAAGLFLVGRLPGVSRAPLPGYFPTTQGVGLVLDVGANVDCRPEHLVQFAQMGHVYVEKVMGKANPSVGLVNVGEEPGKGNELAKAAYPLLQNAGLNFIGNIEGRDVLAHGADVVVCDGFVGNVMLKLGESFSTVLPQMVKREIGKQQLGPEDQRTIATVLRGVTEPFNYENVGGAPLLGIDGTVLIGHGSSSARAITQLIRQAATMVRTGVREAIAETFAEAG
ncbi:MAG: phosphate acyltransferase PlsX [Bacteroidota bacterium]